MAKRVDLSVHRNSVEKRRRAVVRADLLRAVSKHLREVDVRAYAVVTLAADGCGYAFWDTGACVPMWGFPGLVQGVLARNIEASGVEDDWRPALPIRGSEV